MNLEHAETDEQIMVCFPVMKVLRPHLDESKFLAAVRRQQEQGYKLLFIESDGAVQMHLIAFLPACAVDQPIK